MPHQESPQPYTLLNILPVLLLGIPLANYLQLFNQLRDQEAHRHEADNVLQIHSANLDDNQRTDVLPACPSKK